MEKAMGGIISIKGEQKQAGSLHMNTLAITNALREEPQKEQYGYTGKGLTIPITYSSNGEIESIQTVENGKQSFDKFF